VQAGRLVGVAEDVGFSLDASTDTGKARKLGRMIAKHNGRVYGRYKIHYRPDRHDYWLQEMPEHAEKARNT